MFTELLYCLGCVALVSILRPFFPFLASAVFGARDLKKCGAWAVVTGATDGIGKAYCEALAKRGLNVVLISRTLSKLQDCAKEIEEKYKVSTKIVAADFSKASNAGFTDPIAAAIKDLTIGVLVNNVGLSYDMPAYFVEEDVTLDFLKELVEVNANSTVVMSKLVLSGMNARKGGVVINISSAAGIMSCASPMLAGYSASKAFVAALSKSIHYEVANKNIVCQVHAPYLVSSKMSKIKRASIMVPTAEHWVNSSLAMVGYGGTVIVPYFMHFIQDFVAGCLPEEIAGWYVMRQHKDVRKRALAKAKREAEATK